MCHLEASLYSAYGIQAIGQSRNIGGYSGWVSIQLTNRVTSLPVISTMRNEVLSSNLIPNIWY